MNNSENSLYAERITLLRSEMAKHQLDAYIIPTSDPHLSEYLPEYWQARQWLSGFTGSAGTLVVTQDFAGLWADSRYWEQAEHQLEGSGITLQKLVGAQNDHNQWLVQNMPSNATVGVDGAVLSISAKDILLNLFEPKNISLNTEIDLIDFVWQDRPSLPQAEAYPHKLTFCAQAREEKILTIRTQMKQLGATKHILSSLDDIAWITNTRGNDVPYNPVFLSYLLIGMNEVVLFIDQNKLTSSLRRSLEHDLIKIKPYDEIFDYVATTIREDDCVLFDPQKTTTRLINSLDKNTRLIPHINPSVFLKSQKKEEDLLHIRQAMENDGVALCQFFCWLEQALSENKHPITELTIDEKLTEFRSKQEYYISNSFSTIAGFNANGALPHYRATEEHHATIEGNGLLLIDSGAQYETGTTDITRVVPIGNISAEQKQDFTFVLKSHIALATTYFPEGLASPLLDIIARAPLWANQMDFGHGTGHGVGYFLNVHEGPQVISYRAPALPQTQMKAGMITSNEPGLYRPNQWGIRIENLLATIPVENPKECDFGEYLCFETLTLCPIDTRCIDVSLLTTAEISWINDYHATVFNRLGHKLSDKPLAWLKERTQPIGSLV